MVNPESALQLQRLLEMLKRKALETSNAHSQPASNEIFTRPVVKQNCEMVNPEASSRLQRLLDILTKKTVEGSIGWDERVFEKLFSISLARSTFVIERGHQNVIDLFAFEIYDSTGAMVARVTSTDEQYPESIREEIRALWTAVSTRASRLVSLLDEVLHTLEERPPSAYGD
jgi:hypothetical protein